MPTVWVSLVIGDVHAVFLYREFEKEEKLWTHGEVLKRELGQMKLT